MYFKLGGTVLSKFGIVENIIFEGSCFVEHSESFNMSPRLSKLVQY